MADRTIRTSGTNARRTTGMLLAAAVALIFAGILLYIAVMNRAAAPTSALPGSVIDIGKAPETINPTTDPNQIQASEAARMQFVDKSDPSRLSSELAFDRLDPVGPGYYTLAQPRAWVYMRDGRILHIRADSGRVRMPSRTQQPESGEFRGTVIVRLFPPPAPGAAPHPIDPEKDTPAIVAITDSVAFDSILLELTTQDPVQLSAKNMLFEGDGLLVRANQVKERLELLKTKGRFVRFNPKIKTVAVAAPAPKPAPDAPPSAPAAPTDKPAAPVIATAPAPERIHKEQLYRAIFGDNVSVTQTTRQLKSDTLEVFARLIDNQLPENAFGTLAVEAPAAKTPATPTTAPLAAKSPDAPKGEAPNSTLTDAAPATALATPAAPKTPYLFESAGDEDIVMRWTGQLVLTPIIDQPTPIELQNGNHFAARFSADKPGGQSAVVLTDSANNARGECAKIEYAATSRSLSLLSGPDATNVKFEAPDSGLLIAPTVKIDLGTGVAQIPGGGRLLAMRNGATTISSSASTDPAGPIPQDQLRQITWSDQADFRFRVVNGRITGALDWAQFKGTVLGRDHLSSVSGDTLTADFVPIGKQPSAIKHLKVEGNALAIGGKRTPEPNRPQPPLDPYIACDSFDVGFEPSKASPDEMDPVLAVAIGAVKAADQSSSLRAARLETVIARDPKNPGSLIITDVLAQRNVEVERSDGVSARADVLRANPIARTAQLTGENISFGRGSSIIHGKQADLDDAAGTLTMYGPGSLDHIQTDPVPTQLTDASDNSAALLVRTADPTHITATWVKGMMFNNIKGTVECVGDAIVTTASALQTQTLRSERLNLWLTPADQMRTSAAPAPAPAGTGAMAIGDNRRLLRAEAIGASEDREGAPHATIETRRYLPPAASGEDRILEQLFYVEGPRITADDVKGKITVPAAGRAIIRDQRAADAQQHIATSTGLPLASGSTKGTSRFTWAESMEFTRSTGILTMKKDVELVHLPTASGQVTRLVAMQMDATFNVPADPHAAPTGATGRSAELVRAEANGAVYVESAQQRLIADSFIYNAQAGTADASAAGGNRVTLYDDRKGTQLVARKLFWDLAHDRVEIREAAPMTAPR